MEEKEFENIGEVNLKLFQSKNLTVGELKKILEGIDDSCLVKISVNGPVKKEGKKNGWFKGKEKEQITKKTEKGWKVDYAKIPPSFLEFVEQEGYMLVSSHKRVAVESVLYPDIENDAQTKDLGLEVVLFLKREKSIT